MARIEQKNTGPFYWPDVPPEARPGLAKARTQRQVREAEENRKLREKLEPKR